MESLKKAMSSVDTDKVISADQYESILSRANRFISGYGQVKLGMQSKWIANTRWARNEIISSGDSRNNTISLWRDINGANENVSLSNHSDAELKRAIEVCERYLQLKPENDLGPKLPQLAEEIVPVPEVWHASTISMEESARADIFHELSREAHKEGMLSAGYLEVAALARGSRRLPAGEIRYSRLTDAQLSITVRSPDGSGSGWAGITWDNWDRVDGHQIAAVALDKCLRSRNPVTIEPGRYTVILEPQATHDLVSPLFSEDTLSREAAEHPQYKTPYTLKPGYSKIGLKLFDDRLKVYTDPYHPDCYYYPYGFYGAYKKATWVNGGILKELSYSRSYAISKLGSNDSKYGSSSYILEGVGQGTNRDLESMIANTERGLLVTRFHVDRVLDPSSMLSTGLTRDGLWLIEKGKISQAVKNMRFTESPVFVLNNVVEYGIPKRVFSPGTPCLVPALKANDFSFTATVSAI